MDPASSRRPWEMVTSPTQTQTLPSISTLTRAVDTRPSDKGSLSAGPGPMERNSGSWTGNSGVLSNSSGQSNNTMPYLNSSTNHSPSQSHQPYTPEPPNGHRGKYTSVPHPGHTSQNHDAHRGSGDFDDSRRVSVDSRIHQGMDSLRLGPSSPYNASANVSQSSLASSLQQQRNSLRDSRYSTGSGPMSPSWPPRGMDRHYSGRVAPRIAPVIMENPRSEGRYAAEPVRGQPYAFPDPDAQAPPPPSSQSGRPDSSISRRNSYASSFTNSLYSDFNRQLPAGQKELPEHHHHTGMPTHERVQHLKSDPESPNSVTPYSRTPELRVTHKLAERKRRSEMKDCFEQLRAKLPANQNNKSSKWETLARAIDYIAQLEGQNKQLMVEQDRHRNQMHDLEMQMKEMNARISHPGAYPPPSNAMPNSPVGYPQHYGNGVDSQHEPPRTLPPIINGAMQGVQYGDDRR